MIIYFSGVRIQDENKKEAIFEASIKLVNEIGFVAASVAKIAKEARVSPATLYIYYKNKEDLLISIYIEIKKKLSAAMLIDFDENAELKVSLKKIWLNAFEYISKHREYFKFTEQFSNSPFNELVDHSKLEKHFEPFLIAVKTGIRNKIIKNVELDILAVFAFYPVLTLSNSRVCKNIKMTKENIDTAFELAWDAIKV